MFVGNKATASAVMSSLPHHLAQLFSEMWVRCFKGWMFSEVLAVSLFPLLLLLIKNCPPVPSGECLAGSFVWHILAAFGLL